MHLANQQSIQINGIDMKDLYINDVLIWQAQLSKIPDEYQEVEYIGRAANTTTTYIDLGFAFDTAATMYIGYERVSTNSQWFGAAENSGKYRCMITEGTGVIAYGSGSSGYITASIPNRDGYRYFKYTLKPGMMEFEDIENGDYENDPNNIEFTMTSNLALLGQHYNGSYRATGTINIYSFKYYDKNDNLICELVPCYRKSDGEIGMYDIVRKMFLVNQGAGEFIKGADV